MFYLWKDVVGQMRMNRLKVDCIDLEHFLVVTDGQSALSRYYITIFFAPFPVLSSNAVTAHHQLGPSASPADRWRCLDLRGHYFWIPHCHQTDNMQNIQVKSMPDLFGVGGRYVDNYRHVFITVFPLKKYCLWVSLLAIGIVLCSLLKKDV